MVTAEISGLYTQPRKLPVAQDYISEMSAAGPSVFWKFGWRGTWVWRCLCNEMGHRWLRAAQMLGVLNLLGDAELRWKLVRTGRSHFIFLIGWEWLFPRRSKMVKYWPSRVGQQNQLAFSRAEAGWCAGNVRQCRSHVKGLWMQLLTGNQHLCVRCGLPRNLWAATAACSIFSHD